MRLLSKSTQHAGNHARVPKFEPHPWLPGGHLQTIAGRYLPGRPVRMHSTYSELVASEGDRLTVLDARPAGWRAGDPAALLVHGLGGCARSPYVVRLAARLVDRGIRAVRMNLRGAGSGFGLARGIYHSGRTEDLRTVVEWIAERAPGSPVALIGFSLGANLVLKLAAEAACEPLPAFDCVLAANPPLDLAGCCRHLQRPENRLYDRNFVSQMRREVGRLHARFPDSPRPDLSKVSSLYDFDNIYTAPRNGFANAEDYYARCSAGPLVPGITAPGLVVHAADDPFIPAGLLEEVLFPPQLALELIPNGGHLGYISRTRWLGDRRWLDARFVTWLSERWRRRLRDSMDAEGMSATRTQGGSHSHA